MTCVATVQSQYTNFVSSGKNKTVPAVFHQKKVILLMLH